MQFRKQQLELNMRQQTGSKKEKKGVHQGGSEVKCLPGMREIRVHSLGQEDPLEKEMATHSSVLAWRIPWTEEAGGLGSMGVTGSAHV